MFDFIIANYGCLEESMKLLFESLKIKKISRKHFWNIKEFDTDKMNLNIIEFLRFLIQLCTQEITYVSMIHDIVDQ